VKVGTVDLMPHARTLVRDSLSMRAGESVVLLSDGTGSAPLLEALRIATAEEGAVPVVVSYLPVAFRPLKEYCWFAGRSLLPPLHLPPAVLGALQAADAAVMLIADMEAMLSPDIGMLREAGKRMLMLPHLDSAGARRLLPTSSEEVGAVRATVQRYGEVFVTSHEARVTSAAGTDVQMRIGNWPTRLHHGMPNPGEVQVVPAGQVAVVPNDGTANGVVVIDRTIAHHDYKELHEPIILRVTAGTVTRIEGGVEAHSLQRFLEGLCDERAFHLTELAIGTNPRCKYCGINAPTEDTHAAGTVSFALGCDTHIGGGTPGPVHIDMTMHFSTLVLDGTAVVQDGELALDARSAAVQD